MVALVVIVELCWIVLFGFGFGLGLFGCVLLICLFSCLYMCFVITRLVGLVVGGWCLFVV